MQNQYRLAEVVDASPIFNRRRLLAGIAVGVSFTGISPAEADDELQWDIDEYKEIFGRIAKFQAEIDFLLASEQRPRVYISSREIVPKIPVTGCQGFATSEDIEEHFQSLKINIYHPEVLEQYRLAEENALSRLAGLQDDYQRWSEEVGLDSLIAQQWDLFPRLLEIKTKIPSHPVETAAIARLMARFALDYRGHDKDAVLLGVMQSIAGWSVYAEDDGQ